MSKSEGTAGTGARHYGDELSVLAGLLFDDQEPRVYPEDYCAKCIEEGRLQSETCFHRHWKGRRK